MQILNQNEIQNLNLAPSKTINRPIYDEIAKLEVDQALKIETDEWKSKCSPAIPIHSMTYKSKRKNYALSLRAKQLIGKKFSVRRLTDGWVVIRVK